MDFLVPGRGGSLALVECKAGRTVTPAMAAPMQRLAEALKKKRAAGARGDVPRPPGAEVRCAHARRGAGREGFAMAGFYRGAVTEAGIKHPGPDAMWRNPGGFLCRSEFISFRARKCFSGFGWEWLSFLRSPWVPRSIHFLEVQQRPASRRRPSRSTGLIEQHLTAINRMLMFRPPVILPGGTPSSTPSVYESPGHADKT